MSAAPPNPKPADTLLRRVWTQLTWWRWAALQIKPNYDPAYHRAIVATVARRFAGRLDEPNPAQRHVARGAAHHLSQIALRSKRSAIGFEIACCLAIVPYLVWQLLRGLLASPPPDKTCDGVRLVYRDRFAVNPEVFLIPPELAGDALETRVWSGAALRPSDVSFVAGLLIRLIAIGSAYPVQFALKCAIDLAAVRAALMGLKPRYVMVYAEYNCALTILHWRLAGDGVAIYNVMHGDKAYYANHAFFEVDRCYCWNDFYAELFASEHARADFRLFPNPAFVLTPDDARHQPRGLGYVAPSFDTLAGESGGIDAALQRQADVLNILARRMPVTYRPHPFYAAEGEPMKALLAPEVIVQDPHAVPARHFALDHDVVVGTYSTLMLEAAHLGRRVIVIRTVQVDLLAGYHFFFKMPNVTLCALADLPAAVDAAINQD